MMPFSVLRPWFLGLFSWALLGAGVYCLWHWYDVAHPQVVAQADGEENVVLADDDAWPYLAAGVVLVAWNFVGFLPVLLFLGRPRGDEPQRIRDGEKRVVERPDGTRLNVEIYGDAANPTLVCTHGWSLTSTEWYYVKKLLSDDYRIVVWDLPGLGQSRGPKNNDYSLEKMAGDLDAVVEAVSPNAPVFLIGHSIGGMITQTYCRLFPAKVNERVLGLVLTHTTYVNPLHTALGAPLWKALEKPLIVPMNYLTIALAPLAWLSNWQSYLNGSLHVTSRISSFAGGQTWGQVDLSSRMAAKAWPGVVARGNLAMLDFDARSTLPAINAPTLIIGGKHDRLTKLSASESIDQQVPHGILSIVDAGHLGLWERHEDVCSAIDQFARKYAVTPPVLGGQASVARRSAG
jgi:pimeloyl-ACP methyl ester carboxylesterase